MKHKVILIKKMAFINVNVGKSYEVAYAYTYDEKNTFTSSIDLKSGKLINLESGLSFEYNNGEIDKVSCVIIYYGSDQKLQLYPLHIKVDKSFYREQKIKTLL